MAGISAGFSGAGAKRILTSSAVDNGKSVVRKAGCPTRISKSETSVMALRRGVQRRSRTRWRSSILFSVILQAMLTFSSSFVYPRRSRSFQGRFSVSLSMASKTGAKLIASSEDYARDVLNPNAPRPVMVFFTAPWCGPCRLSMPVVKEVMKQFVGEIDTVEVCTDDLPEVAAESHVVSIPTIQMYCKGELMDTIVGCVAKSVLSSVVDKVLEDAVVKFGVQQNATNGEPP